MADELEKFIVGFFCFKGRCYKMSRFQGFDTNDIDGVSDEGLPNLKEVGSDDIFWDN